MATKPSFGNGYGCNRNCSAEGAHALAKPPMGSINIKPGVGKKHHSNVNFSRKTYQRKAGGGA